MKFIKENFTRLSLFFSLVLVPTFFIYADGGPCPTGKFCNPIASKTIQEFILKFLEGAIKIGIPIIALAIIYSGFLFVAASGNSEKLNKAKSALLYSAIGAAVLLGALAISKIIAETVTGISG